MKIDASTLAVILNGYLAPVIIVAYDRIAESNSQMRVVALLPPMNVSKFSLNYPDKILESRR